MRGMSIKERINRSIGKSKSEAFIRFEFSKFGSPAQVNRAVRELTKEGRLVRLGYGVYAKSRPSSISGKPVPRKSLQGLAFEALRKLNVQVELGIWQKRYRDGKTTQVPMTADIFTGTRRISRKLVLGGQRVFYENTFSKIVPINATSTIAAQAAGRRPRSLKEVALWGGELGGIDSFLREFLDEFYVERNQAKRADMLLDEPPLSADDRVNTYLAAVAEHLAWRYHLVVPEWTGEATRFLKRPFFPSGLESLKATLLVESPTAFRRRMIFVGADPLYRPRRDAAGIGQ